MDLEDYLEAVASAFRAHAFGKTLKSDLLHIDALNGEFHVKVGGLLDGRAVFALKLNGGFFGNREKHGLPNIRGIIVLCDAGTGHTLAIMDSSEITIKRTVAAAMLAAQHLARKHSSVLTVCGCGAQGCIQLEGMVKTLPIETAFLFDLDARKAESLAHRFGGFLQTAKLVPTTNLPESLRRSDVCITCTPSRNFFVHAEDIKPGTFIAAMGADSPEKQELDPSILRSGKVVVDILDQCSRVGELHHAIESGMGVNEVYAELGELIAGKKPGRTSDEEIIIFDATGTALQDAAAASAIYARAETDSQMTSFDFLA